MPVTTSQQITRYFDQFSEAEVTFTREVVQTIMLNTKHVYVKCLGSQWPCIIYAASMTTARIITNQQSGLNDCIQKANKVVQLRFSFTDPDKHDQITFFVPARVAGMTPYGEKNKDLFFVNLEFNQRPPDALIQILGQLLEANVNAKRRKEERIPLSAHSTKQLGLLPAQCSLAVDGIPRKSILRDLSFSGCKAVLMGLPKLLINRSATVTLVFNEPEQRFEIPGTICRHDPVEGRNDIAAFGVQFDEAKVPMAYKMRINSVLKQFRSKAAEPE
ncbi:MAG: PilZN3 domain-containing protein [Spirochaetota bacterium]